jgi:MFS superfamily sulfate permease-like transporter
MFSVGVNEETYTVDVFHSAVFSNYINLKKSLDKLPKNKNIVIDFTNANLIDHSVMESLHRYKNDYEREGGRFSIEGLEQHKPLSAHAFSTRKKKVA